jgi:hypothetical protein
LKKLKVGFLGIVCNLNTRHNVTRVQQAKRMPAKKTTKKQTKKRASAKKRAAPRRAVPERISAAQAYALDMMRNPYKEAMLDPKNGPLVGVPQLHPVDTHRVRVKSSKVYQSTTSDYCWAANPLAGVCSDGFANGDGRLGGVVIGRESGTMISSSTEANAGQLTNAPYTRSQFAALTSGSSVRARVVGFQMTIQNVSSMQDRNGAFTILQDPRHHTLQNMSQSEATAKSESYIVSGAEGKVVLTYGVVEPSEADGWIWDPKVGYANSITTGAYDTGTQDGTEEDTMPGYMGVWWSGTATSDNPQSFLVETHAIVEYIGELVTTLVRDPGPVVDMRTLADTRKRVRENDVHVTHESADGGNHPHSSTSALRRLGHSVEQIAESAVSGLAQGAVTAFTGSPMAGRAANYIAHRGFQFGERLVGRAISGLSHLSLPSPRVSAGGRYIGF